LAIKTLSHKQLFIFNLKSHKLNTALHFKVASALAELSKVKIVPGQSTDDLFCSIVAQHVPDFALFPDNNCFGGALIPNLELGLRAAG
jgi:hypothetical protein